MNYIIYGTGNLFETRLYDLVLKGFPSNAILRINDPIVFEDTKSLIDYPPFFSKKWLLIVDLISIGYSNLVPLIKLMEKPTVQVYARIPIREEFNKPNQDLYKELAGSKVLQAKEDLTVLNSLYPSDSFYKKELYQRLEGIYFSDSAMKYLVESVRSSPDEIDFIVNSIIESGESNLDLTSIRKIVPSSQSRSLRSYLYCIMLAHRGDLKSEWQDRTKKVLVQSAGTIEKPFRILNNVELEPKDTLNIIVGILKHMLKLKKVHLDGYYNLTSIFEQKQDLEAKFYIMRIMSIPKIIEYTKVFSEITYHDLMYILTKFMELKSKDVIYEEDLFMMTKQIMNRHSQEVL